MKKEKNPLEEIEKSINKIQKAFQILERRLKVLDKKINTMKAEYRRNINNLENRLRNLK